MISALESAPPSRGGPDGECGADRKGYNQGKFSGLFRRRLQSGNSRMKVTRHSVDARCGIGWRQACLILDDLTEISAIGFADIARSIAQKNA